MVKLISFLRLNRGLYIEGNDFAANHDTSALLAMFQIDYANAGVDNEISYVSANQNGRFGSRSFGYVTGTYASNSPDRVTRIGAGESILTCQQNFVRGIYFDEGNYRTYGQTISYIGMRNDRNFDRKEYLNAILNELAGYQGTISGMVFDNMTGEPVEGAVIRVKNSDRYAISDVSGNFAIDRVANEQVSIGISRDGYTYAEMDVDFNGEEQIDLDIRLLHPEISVNIDNYTCNIFVDHRDYLPFIVSNYGDGPLTATLAPKGVQLHSHPWESLQTINGRELFNGGWLQAVHYFNDEFWVAGGGANSDDVNLFYRVSREGQILQTLEQPTATRYGWRDMTSDYDFIYAVDSTLIYQISAQTGEATGWTVSTPFNPVSAIAWDSANDLFWVSGITTNISSVDRQGNVVSTVRNNGRFRIYGIGWYAEDPDGYPLYLFCNQVDAVVADVIKMNPQTGDAINVCGLPLGNGERAGSCEIVTNLFPYTTTFLGLMRSGDESIQIVEMATDIEWLEVEPLEIQLEGNAQQDINMWVDASLMNLGQTYDAYIQIDHNTPVDELWVEVHVTVIEEQGVGDGSETPFDFALNSIYPNPFNSSALISFELDRVGFASLSLFDINGREVANLVQGKMDAGSHQVVVDGTALTSGVYLLKLTSTNRTLTRSLTLIK